MSELAVAGGARVWEAVRDHDPAALPRRAKAAKHRHLDEQPAGKGSTLLQAAQERHVLGAAGNVHGSQALQWKGKASTGGCTQCACATTHNLC